MLFISSFLMEAKSENACVFKILAYFKDTEVVKINLEPTTTVCLITALNLIANQSISSLLLQSLMI